MATTLLAKLRTAASADATLSSLLGSSPFRWYDQQLAQGTAFPAVTAEITTRVRQYSVNSLLLTAQYRVTFKVFDPDPQQSRAVALAIEQFLTGFNAYSSAAPAGQLQPNQVVMGPRDFGIAETQPLTNLQILDAMIWNNETL